MDSLENQVRAVIDLLRGMNLTIGGAKQVLEWAIRWLDNEPLEIR